jgi:hypothetical protein
VRIRRATGTDRIVRTAVWMYMAPRAAIGVLLLAMLGLGAFLVLVQVPIVILRRLGA